MRGIEELEERLKKKKKRKPNQNPLVTSLINPGHALLTELQQELEWSCSTMVTTQTQVDPGWMKQNQIKALGSLLFPHLTLKARSIHTDAECCTCSVINDVSVQSFCHKSLVWWLQVQLSAVTVPAHQPKHHWKYFYTLHEKKVILGPIHCSSDPAADIPAKNLHSLMQTAPVTAPALCQRGMKMNCPDFGAYNIAEPTLSPSRSARAQQWGRKWIEVRTPHCLRF